MSVGSDITWAVAREHLRIVSQKELAAALGVSVRTIHRWVKSKQLPEPRRTPTGRIGGWPLKVLKEAGLF
ncbi:MerR family transcriptional regulator [Vibrio astriarenae]